MKLILANPRGFCAGVDRAIKMVEELLEIFPEPVYVRHEIVHNRVVVDELRTRGAVFVDEVSEIPPGAVAVLSAHGAPPEVYADAKSRDLRLFDATCPLVSKVHLEVARHARHGRSVAVIGHRNHVEVIGTVGYYNSAAGGAIHIVESTEEASRLEVPDPDRIGYVSQTTLAVDQTQRVVDVLRSRFPRLVGPHSNDICYATQNRQDAVRTLAGDCDLIIVIGAPHSSNSVRMREVAETCGVEARLIERPSEIEPQWLSGRTRIGLTSSASAPESLVAGTVEHMLFLAPALVVESTGEPERVSFNMPTALRGHGSAGGFEP